MAACLRNMLRWHHCTRMWHCLLQAHAGEATCNSACLAERDPSLAFA